MPSIGRIVDVAEALKTPAVAVCAQHCTHRHHQASTCSRCEQVCPAQAISVSADGPEVDALSCTDCGACASVCPTGALLPLKPTDPALVETIAAKVALYDSVTIACAKVPAPGSDVVVLPCLARLDPSLLLFAFAKGAASVSLRTGACDECPASQLAGHVASVVADGRRFLEALRLPGRIDLDEGQEHSEPEDAQPAGLTRRGFLQLFRKGGVVYAAKTVDGFLPEPGAAVAEKKPRRENPAHVPMKRVLLLESLRALVPEGSALREAHLPFMAPALDRTRCDGCAICGRICPTGALGIEEDEDGGALRITCRQRACVACGLCAEICRQQALSLARISVDSVLACDGQSRTLFERTQREAEPLYGSVEDKMKQLLGAAIYRS
jgi:ferredoxin